MKFDDITVLLGEFGKYQKIIYVVVCIPVIFCGAQMLSSVFTLAIPKYRCRLKAYIEDSFSVQNYNHSVAINKSIPWAEGSNGAKIYDHCKIFSTNENTSYNSMYSPINTSTMSCDSWVYDQSMFETTFITKEGLICGKEIYRANANMIMMGGMLVGALVLGIFADIFGRRSAMMVSAVLHVGSAFGSSFAPNYAAFVAFRFIIGVTNMGLFMSAFVIGMELVGPSYRVAAGIIIELFWCVGLYLLLLVAYFERTWNNLQLWLACPSVILLLYYWFLPESPRWLISKGRYKEANKIIQRCAKVNGVNLPEKVVDSSTEEKTEAESVLKMFTVPTLLVRTLIIYLNWCVVSMVYYGLGLNVGNLDGDIYVNFAINSSFELVAYIVCLIILNKVGRKFLHAGSMILGGVACLCTIFTVLYADKSLFWMTVVLANVGKFGVSGAYAILFVWSAELFPTMVRNSGIGTSSTMAQVGSMLCPYVADLSTFVDGDFGKALPLIIFGGLSLIAGVLALFLPETKGKVLPETIEDAVNFERQQPHVGNQLIIDSFRKFAIDKNISYNYTMS